MAGQTSPEGPEHAVLAERDSERKREREGVGGEGAERDLSDQKDPSMRCLRSINGRLTRRCVPAAGVEGMCMYGKRAAVCVHVLA